MSCPCGKSCWSTNNIIPRCCSSSKPLYDCFRHTTDPALHSDARNMFDTPVVAMFESWVWVPIVLNIQIVCISSHLRTDQPFLFDPSQKSPQRRRFVFRRLVTWFAFRWMITWHGLYCVIDPDFICFFDEREGGGGRARGREEERGEREGEDGMKGGESGPRIPNLPVSFLSISLPLSLFLSLSLFRSLSPHLPSPWHSSCRNNL